MGSAAEFKEPTTGTEEPLQLQEEEEEHIFELERKKTSSSPHAKGHDNTDTSTVTTHTSSSSSFSGEEISDLQNGEGEHIAIHNLEVPEKETEVDFHDGNNCIVYFDGEHGIWKCRHCDWTYKDGSLLCFETKGTEPAGAEPDAHESRAADLLNQEKNESGSENGSTSEDNKRSREIEEVQDGDFSIDLTPVGQPTGDVIEEELYIDDAEDYDVEKVLDNQETHDLFCPNCNSCITKRVVLKRRKRRIRHVSKDPKQDPKRVKGPQHSDLPFHSEDNLPSVDGSGNPVQESFVFKCLSCFSIFIPSRGVEGLNTQPKPQVEAEGESNWFSSLFGFKKKEPGESMPSVPEANPPRGILNVSGENMTGSTANIPSKAPAFVQDGAATPVQDVSEISASQDKEPVDTTLIPVVNSHNVDVEDGQKIDKDDTSASDGNHSPEKGRLSPIRPPRDMNISSTVTSGPDGVRVETIIHSEGVPHRFEGTGTSDTGKPDISVTNVTGVMDTGDNVITTSLPSPGIVIPPLSSLEEGSLTEPLLRPVVEGRTLEILKSIVYGGLIESITSLGVISSAAGSGASMLNILVLGIANLMGGLILMIHNLQELREEEPRRTTTENNQTNGQEEGRYKRLLGRRENFTLHASVAILSFMVVGLLPPVVYYFSFSKTHNRDYKVASVFGSSLVCIILLAIAKARVNTPRGSYLKSILYYALIAVSVSGISYVVGNFVDQLLEKYGWSDGSETPAGEMMLALMGRKAGSFGYSSSY